MEAKMVTFNQPNGNFVILAGGPGAGKSYVSQHFIDLDNVKPFNVDNYRVAIAKKLWGNNWKEMISTDEGYKKILDLTHTTSDPRNRTIQFLKNFLEEELERPNEEDLDKRISEALSHYITLVTGIPRPKSAQEQRRLKTQEQQRIAQSRQRPPARKKGQRRKKNK